MVKILPLAPCLHLLKLVFFKILVIPVMCFRVSYVDFTMGRMGFTPLKTAVILMQKKYHDTTREHKAIQPFEEVVSILEAVGPSLFPCCSSCSCQPGTSHWGVAGWVFCLMLAVTCTGNYLHMVWSWEQLHCCPNAVSAWVQTSGFLLLVSMPCGPELPYLAGNPSNCLLSNLVCQKESVKIRKTTNSSLAPKWRENK